MDSCVNRNHAKDERMNEQVILSFTSPQMCECQSVQTKRTSLFHTSNILHKRFASNSSSPSASLFVILCIMSARGDTSS